jgi:hypothetical protein
VDHEFVALGGDQHNELQKVCRPTWTDDEPPVRLVAEKNADRLVGKCIGDVLIQDSMASSRRMDVHPVKCNTSIDRLLPAKRSLIPNGVRIQFRQARRTFSQVMARFKLRSVGDRETAP